MNYLSVCSGIEAATVAWHPLGWHALAYAEIDKFPSAVLAHHYPSVPNLGDFTGIGESDVGAPVDVMVGGTPCQSFSVAGLRGGLDDDRGNLALEYLKLAQRLRPKWLVWENVPGVLSSAGGRDFGSILGGMGELGYGWAYRVLDAQFFGVPQRRRRVFVVGHLGDWRRAAAVLFERHSLQGHSAPRRQAGEGIASTIEASLGRRCGQPNDHDVAWGLVSGSLNANSGRQQIEQAYIPVAHTLNAKGGAGRMDYETETLLAHSLRGGGFDASEDGTGRGTPLIAFSSKDHGADAGETAPTLRAGGHAGSHANAGVPPAIAFNWQDNHAFNATCDATDSLRRNQTEAVATFAENGRGEVFEGADNRALQTQGGNPGQGYAAARIGTSVRRLTPRECEKLQGFKPDYTLIPMSRGLRKTVDAEMAEYYRRTQPELPDRIIRTLAADGPRYKALGNSMAVPVMRWIGMRINQVEAIHGV